MCRSKISPTDFWPGKLLQINCIFGSLLDCTHVFSSPLKRYRITLTNLNSHLKIKSLFPFAVDAMDSKHLASVIMAKAQRSFHLGFLRMRPDRPKEEHGGGLAVLVNNWWFQPGGFTVEYRLGSLEIELLVCHNAVIQQVFSQGLLQIRSKTKCYWRSFLPTALPFTTLCQYLDISNEILFLKCLWANRLRL